MKHITLIAGARPNFMKIAPIVHSIDRANSLGANLQYKLVHTGQHYDEKMSGNFFRDLGIPSPDANLQAGGGTQAEQTAQIMVGFERYLLDNPTDLVVVVGDVTSTMACSIVAQKLHTKVAHVEAGIRSGDWSMPEEINRLVTDSITNYFFTTSRVANANLASSGINEDQIYFVGNTMIDTLLTQQANFKKPHIWDNLKLSNNNYIVLTIHRPSNVDNQSKLKQLLDEVLAHSSTLDIVFPVHPRTAKVIEQIGVSNKHLHLVEPLGYLEFNYLVQHAKAVITDSGGVTEEATVMGVPCITLRDTTERPETVTEGTNELVGTDPVKIKNAMDKLLSGTWKRGSIPELWDGKAAQRIVDVLLNLEGNE